MPTKHFCQMLPFYFTIGILKSQFSCNYTDIASLAGFSPTKSNLCSLVE